MTEFHEDMQQILEAQRETIFQSLHADQKNLIHVDGIWKNIWDLTRRMLSLPFQLVSNLLKQLNDIENIHVQWREIYKRSYCSTGFLGTLKDGLTKADYDSEAWKTYQMVNKEKAFGQGDTERVLTRAPTQQTNNNFQNNKSPQLNNNNQRGISANYKGQYPIPGFNKAVYLQQQNNPQHNNNNTVYRRASQLGGQPALTDGR
eukprot:GHVR01151788.1.p1 GENE.GHVR01151788.1~~GHVR01151788.1.p1  ORF type:complete len:203 (-),score=24.85 GHVR01151788.1:857-1465(-)